MIKSVLIANRGEIAVRIIRACRELGIRAVAVYSEADAQAMHVREAGEAVPIGPAAPGESYLRVDSMIEAARATDSEAIHPGYGFLSENAAFAEAVRAAGLIFVGPPADAIRKMGSKTEARALMQAAGVPVVPGYQDESQDAAAFERAAGRIGYPVLVKAAGGGGGRGMRVVREAGQLAEALAGAQREAGMSFGDPKIFLEKFVEGARHIEFQVFGDAHGNVVHLFERECSIQRRHQKLIEESPSPLFVGHPALREHMAEAAVAAAKAVGYQNAGTVEFIVDPHSLAFYFLEINTRLQVEHPVTELLTGIDLVKLQLRIAAGEALPFSQAEVGARGHAIEARVYAEDPANHFYPSTGTILKAVEPHGPGVRVDTGFETGDAVTPHYDALLTKVIAQGTTRDEALQRLDAALQRFVILGVSSNLPFLRAVLAHPEFQAGTATTQFVEAHLAELLPGTTESLPAAALIAAALADVAGVPTGPAIMPDGQAQAQDPWARPDSFRVGD